MSHKSSAQIQMELAQPFAPEDLEWRVQTAVADKARGLVVPFVTNRAIQERLDSVVGADNWYNEFKPWHRFTTKAKNSDKLIDKEVISQLCGIFIYFEDRKEWIGKWDGAENTDIEAVKGGLSDSMKRAAYQWGIGRTLYKMDDVWADIEKRGRNWFIKDSARPKLDRAYMDLLDRLHLIPAKAGGVQSQLTPKGTAEDTPRAENRQPVSEGGQTSGTVSPLETSKSPATLERTPDLTVLNVTQQNGMSGVSTSMVLQTTNGKKVLGFVRGAHPELKGGARLFNVRKTRRQKDSVVYYELESFEIEEAAA